MKSTILSDLEKDRKFKRNNFPSSLFYTNFLFIAPSLLIFCGLAGALYLFKINQLISLIVIPYIVLFVIGTIWLKSIRLHIVRSKIDNEDSFLTCWAIPVQEEKNISYFLFTTNNKRHDKYYIENLKKKIKIDFEEYIQNIKKGQSIFLSSDSITEEKVYLGALDNSIIKRKNPNRSEGENLPILFIDEKHIDVIQGRHLY